MIQKLKIKKAEVSGTTGHDLLLTLETKLGKFRYAHHSPAYETFKRLNPHLVVKYDFGDPTKMKGKLLHLERREK